MHTAVCNVRLIFCLRFLLIYQFDLFTSLLEIVIDAV